MRLGFCLECEKPIEDARLEILGMDTEFCSKCAHSAEAVQDMPLRKGVTFSPPSTFNSYSQAVSSLTKKLALPRRPTYLKTTIFDHGLPKTRLIKRNNPGVCVVTFDDDDMPMTLSRRKFVTQHIFPYGQEIELDLNEEPQAVIAEV